MPSFGVTARYRKNKRNTIIDTAEIRNYPGSMYSGAGSNSLSAINNGTFTFTPADLKTPEYTVTAIIFEYDMTDSTGAGTTAIELNGVNSSTVSTHNGSKDTCRYYVPIRSYSGSTVIKILDGSSAAHTVTYENCRMTAVLAKAV